MRHSSQALVAAAVMGHRQRARPCPRHMCLPQRMGWRAPTPTTPAATRCVGCQLRDAVAWLCATAAVTALRIWLTRRCSVCAARTHARTHTDPVLQFSSPCGCAPNTHTHTHTYARARMHALIMQPFASTTATPRITQALLDYVWYQPERVGVSSCLPIPTPDQLGGFIPNTRWPSDHLAVVYDLEVKPWPQ
jgi:hypothetical protein